MAKYKLRLGDCLDVMSTIKDNGIDAVICDPPYGYNFMGREWDHGVPGTPYWKEALRVAKPGAHLLAFGGTRTHHRLMVAIEDAGWEIRDCLMWVYGSGMPKSQNTALAIDKAAGAIGVRGKAFRTAGAGERKDIRDANGEAGMAYTEPITEAAKQWDGWGTGLKPAWEPIILARKPISEKTVAANVLKWGTGAINVDGCKIGTEQTVTRVSGGKGFGSNFRDDNWQPPTESYSHINNGRWPANLLLDEEAGILLDEQSGDRKGWSSQKHNSFNPYGGNSLLKSETKREGFHEGYNDSGGTSRFFYCSKASKSDRGEGNDHPTVKPTSLMRYLCKLITPPNGIILDPFMGSGSTGKAALLENFLFYGIDADEHAFEIASRRIKEVVA